MKKILLLITLLLLIGCRQEAIIYKEEVVEEAIEELEVEYIEYIEEKDLKAYVMLANERTSIIDLEALHNEMLVKLAEVVDDDLLLEDQVSLIEETVFTVLDQWRYDIVMDIVLDSGNQINEDDFEMIVSRTSINNAYEVMLAYEMIVLRKDRE